MIKIPFDCNKYNDVYCSFKPLTDWLNENVKNWRLECDPDGRAARGNHDIPYIWGMYFILIEDEETAIMFKLKFGL